MKQLCTKCIYTNVPSTTQTYKEHDVLFLEGDELLYSFMILKGLVKISKITVNGEEKIFDIFGPKDFVALVSMLKEDTHYIATATCLTDVTVNKLPKKEVLEEYKKNNAFKDMCISCAMMRTNLFQSHLFQSTNTNIEERILLVLRYLTKKFGETTDSYFILNLPFSKTTLSNIIGIRRETLSRKCTSMQKKGLLEIEKNKYKFKRM